MIVYFHNIILLRSGGALSSVDKINISNAASLHCWQIQNISLMALGKLNKQKSSDLYHNSSLRPPSSAWTFQLFQSQNFSIERFSPEPLSSLCVRTIVLSRHLDMKHSVISGHNLSEFEWKKDMINPVFPAPPTKPCASVNYLNLTGRGREAKWQPASVTTLVSDLRAGHRAGGTGVVSVRPPLLEWQRDG